MGLSCLYHIPRYMDDLHPNNRCGINLISPLYIINDNYRNLIEIKIITYTTLPPFIKWKRKCLSYIETKDTMKRDYF